MDIMTKINKEEFLKRVNARLQADLPDEEVVSSKSHHLYTVEQVWDAVEAEIKHIVRCGCRLSLTGFGSFYAQTHRGHPVQFGGQKEKVHDYKVFKFSASNVLNKMLRDDAD